MAKFQAFRETTLPSTLEPYSIYIVAPPLKPDYIELYATNSLGDNVKRIINNNDVQSLIDTALSNISTLEVVADITERDALVLTKNTPVYVADASADSTVTSGGASYIYKVDTNNWIKTSEAESLDIVLNWDNLINKPNSTISQIDNAVNNSHTHSNKTQLDKIDEDSNGNFIYNGALPVIAWSSTEW